MNKVYIYISLLEFYYASENIFHIWPFNTISFSTGHWTIKLDLKAKK